MEKTLDSQVNLTKLVHVKMTAKGKSGPVEGLFIPIEKNMLEVDDYGVHIPIRIIYRSEQDDKKQNGFISKKIGTKVWKSLSETEQTLMKDYSNEDTKKMTPILGNVKDWNSQSFSSGAASDETFGDDDPLPF